ncbi:MAG: zf-HC2 domain-containing protein [Pirellulales bacterium]|nr:zf-HC2 domain-containing protein [Pirellulales bacterium]
MKNRSNKPAELSSQTGDDSNRNSAPDGAQPQWELCPQGAVNRVVRQVRADRLRICLLKNGTYAGSTVAVLLVIGITYWTASDNPIPVDPPGPLPLHNVRRISCSDVLKHLPAYLAGNVNAELESRIDEHMRNCKHCRKHIPHGHPKASFFVAVGEAQPADRGMQSVPLPMVVSLNR